MENRGKSAPNKDMQPMILQSSQNPRGDRRLFRTSATDNPPKRQAAQKQMIRQPQV